MSEKSKVREWTLVGAAGYPSLYAYGDPVPVNENVKAVEIEAYHALDEKYNHAVNKFAEESLKRVELSDKFMKLTNKCERYRQALAKIADPRLRDHKEPDSYTELGCVMHMASEALGE